MKLPPFDTSEAFSKQIRIETLKMVYHAKASHIGGAFSMADILAVLYFNFFDSRDHDLTQPDRNRLLLSKGHACTSLYATLALLGYFPLSDLSEYAKDGSIFIAHASHKVPGVEFSTGSLGHALPVACGISVANKNLKFTNRTYALLSDGELNEGSNWEALLFAQHHKLSNLTIIIDYNKIQSFGTTNDIINLEPLREKFLNFNFNVFDIDGHNHLELHQAFEAVNQSAKPCIIIANTVKGKGVSFMENELSWHYKSPSESQYLEALTQLTS